MPDTPTDDLCARARADVEARRVGQERTDELIAHYTKLCASAPSRGGFEMMRALELALLASPKVEGLRLVIARNLPASLNATIGGLVFREGDDVGIPMPDNPWRLRSDSSLERQIEVLWGSADQPDFAAELGKRTVGLALLHHAAGTVSLAYLMYRERDRYEVPAVLADAPRPAFDRRLALEWEPFGELALLTCAAPIRELPPLDDIRVPDSLAELYAVHGGMHGDIWHLCGPRSLTRWDRARGDLRPTPVPTHGRKETHYARDLVAFFSYGDDRSDLFDFAEDPDDPPVRAWGDGRLYTDEPQPFWDWFLGNTDMFLFRPDGVT